MSVPADSQGIFLISPRGYTKKSITLNLVEGSGASAQSVVARSGSITGEEGKGITTLVSMVVMMRLLQLEALKFLHNMQK
mmetsp:Transcript_165232/g.530330  ORF Transcript_165232/g.530330 Transcript_165232/m.530330 type:complete len:80 (-) Transcript_165232:145-384(-)